jgi:hypothetical protein
MGLSTPESVQDGWEKLMRVANYAEDALAYFCE